MLHFLFLQSPFGFPCGSAGKESVCNARDHSSIPGLERSAGKGIGYPLQYSWASLVTQLVKNLPAMQETWIWPLGCKDPLEKGKATHSSILDWRIHGLYSPWGGKESDDWATYTFTSQPSSWFVPTTVRVLKGPWAAPWKGDTGREEFPERVHGNRPR